MDLLKKPTHLKKPLVISFSAESSNWHSIAVSARVKSEKQRGQSFTDDEDLNISIDEDAFEKAANFSGGVQRNTLKTVYFVRHLTKGVHTLTLRPDEGAAVERIEVSEVDNLSPFHLELNLQAERRDGRPWITFVFSNVTLKQFTIKGKTEWKPFDGDDLKIVVDGIVKQNLLSLLHRHWVFASNIFRKFFNKEGFERTFYENLPQKDNHYLEIWADETPTIYSLDFLLEASTDQNGTPQATTAALRPYNSGSPKLDFNRFDNHVVSAAKTWNDEFLSQKYPPPKPLDPNLIKAMLYVESTMGYGASPLYPAYPDVMQVADPANPAIHTLRNDRWVDPKTGRIAREYEWAKGGIQVLEYKNAKADTAEQSILWGVRWLYHKAQKIEEGGKRTWLSWEEAVKAYNGGGDPDYQKKVYKIYNEGTTLDGIKLFQTVILAVGVALTFLSFALFYNQQGKFYLTKEPISHSNNYQLSINVLDGLGTHRLPFSVILTDEPALSEFYRDPITVEVLETQTLTKEKFIAVRGKNNSNYEVVAILSYNDGKFMIRQKISDENDYKNVFKAADSIITGDFDDNPEEVVYEKTVIHYTGKPDQLWQSRYRWDNRRQAYAYIGTVKIPITPKGSY